MTRPAAVVIKKYGNRRLYNTLASKYVNLEDLATLVRNGTDVKVVDAKTGADLTRLTLTQIIMEEAKEEPVGLPVELLKQLILASDKMRRDFMTWYLKSAFDSYQKVQGALQSGLAQIGSAAISPLETIRNLLDVSTAGPKAADAEVEQLRSRVAELERQVKQKRLPSKQAAGKGRK